VSYFCNIKKIPKVNNNAVGKTILACEGLKSRKNACMYIHVLRHSGSPCLRGLLLQKNVVYSLNNRYSKNFFCPESISDPKFSHVKEPPWRPPSLEAPTKRLKEVRAVQGDSQSPKCGTVQVCPRTTFFCRHPNDRPSKCQHPNCRHKNVDITYLLAIS
jgi:hypothetical protein